MANITNINIPAGWTRAAGFPKFDLEDGWAAQDCFYTDYNESSVTAVAQALLGTQLDAEGAVNLQFSGLYCKNVRVEPFDNKGSLQKITMSYSSQSNSDKAAAAGDGDAVVCTLDDGGLEMPLDSKKTNGDFWFSGYKTKWLHELYAKCEIHDGELIQAQTPSWWATATDTIITGADASMYHWKRGSNNDIPQQFKDVDKKTYIWLKICERTKRAESCLVPSPVVVEKAFYKDIADAQSLAAKVGDIAEPEERFGIVGGKFLITSASVYKDGRLWCAQRNFTWAPDWDSDLYGGA